MQAGRPNGGAEQQLRESEARYRTLVETSSDAFALCGPDGTITFTNGRAVEMFRFRALEDILGQSVFALVAPEDRARALEGMQRRVTLQELAGRNTEYLLQRADGSVFHGEISSTIVLDSEGRPEALAIVCRDITERRRREEELLQLHRETEKAAAERAAILGQIADGVVITDATGTIIFVNEAVKQIYGRAEVGVPVEEYANRYALQRLDGTPFPPHELPLARAVERGETLVNQEVRVARPDGTSAIVLVSAAPVRAEDGSFLGAVLTARDMTAQYDVAQQKDNFLSAAAHDLKTPLTTIKGMSQLLRRMLDGPEAPSPQKLRAGLDRIDGTATRMVVMINEMLDLARIQLGRQLELTRRCVDLVPLVEEVLEDARSSRRHTFVLQIDEPRIVGPWDGFRIERVLGNLLSNAVKYSPEGGEIMVSLSIEGNEAVMDVRDEGIGIPEEDLPYIFERFHRASNVTGKIPGTGLGLAGVRQIVEQHGGSVTARNISPGALFTVRLPMDQGE